MRIANRRAMEYFLEFKDKYRWRSGIEATFSEMHKKTAYKRLRVRGLPAVARLKAIAVNLFRATAVRKAVGLRRGPCSSKIRHSAYYFFQRTVFEIYEVACKYFQASEG